MPSYPIAVRSSGTVVPLTALLLLTGPLLAASALPAQPTVTFSDLAREPGSGLAYARTESPRDAALDVLKAQGTIGFRDFTAAPMKSRGAPGVAVFDHDGDGDLDLYVTNGPGTANSLFSNQLREAGEVFFTEVAEAAGVAARDQDSSGVCFGDLDNDGDPDLLVLGTDASERLFENLGGGRFADVTAASGLSEDGLVATSCSLGDVDGDGLLDIAVANAFDHRDQVAINVEPFALNHANHLWLNRGGLTFREVAAERGLHDLFLPPEAPPGAATITWALALVDLDQDGDVDLLQADDQASVAPAAFGGIDRGYLQVFENDGSGRFANVTAQRRLGRPGAWMGLAFGDFDRNGTLDFFATNVGNHFAAGNSGQTDFSIFNGDSRWFLQGLDGVFLDRADEGVLHTPFGWGASATDYDNDGATDVIYHGGLDLVTGVATNPGVVYAGDGTGDFRRDAEALAGSTDHRRRTVHGSAVGDLDGNGFPDVVSVSNFDMPEPIPFRPVPELGSEFDPDAAWVSVFDFDPETFTFTYNGVEFGDGSLSVELNSGDNGNGWAKVRLLGGKGLIPGGTVNRDGIGAVVRYLPRPGDAWVTTPILGGASHASQDALTATFGLGTAQRGHVEVLWPGGVRNRFYNLRAGESLVFPEIPCSFDDGRAFRPYLACVTNALDDLVQAGVLTRGLRARFLMSALRAYSRNASPNCGSGPVRHLSGLFAPPYSRN